MVNHTYSAGLGKVISGTYQNAQIEVLEQAVVSNIEALHHQLFQGHLQHKHEPVQQIKVRKI